MSICMTKYKKISQWELLQEAIKGGHSKRLNAILHTCPDDEFCINYFKILEYVKPKLQRAEVSSIAEDQVITIVHSYPLAK